MYVVRWPASMGGLTILKLTRILLARSNTRRFSTICEKEYSDYNFEADIDPSRKVINENKEHKHSDVTSALKQAQVLGLVHKPKPPPSQ